MTAPLLRYAAECIGPGVVLLRDQAVSDAMVLVRESLKTMRPNAVALPRCQRLLRELERAYVLSVSPERRDDVVSFGALEESSCQDETDEITTREAAHLLGVDVRTVQRLAPALGGRRLGGVWVLSRRLVLTHKTVREQEFNDRAAA